MSTITSFPVAGNILLQENWLLLEKSRPSYLSLDF